MISGIAAEDQGGAQAGHTSSGGGDAFPALVFSLLGSVCISVNPCVGQNHRQATLQCSILALKLHKQQSFV